MAYSYRVSHNTMSRIVREVCTAIYEELKGTYLRCPRTETEWEAVAEGFWKRWNLPNTLGISLSLERAFTRSIAGAIDGKHVQVKKPPNSGSAYYNYKQHFSIVLLAVCDSRYRILYADFGNYGADGDARIYGRSDLLRCAVDGTLNVPAAVELPGSDRKLPHFFVADAAFPLSTHLMKPFTGGGLTHDQRIYNYR